ncbi:hypothetical protein CCL16_24610 [Pseudomonas syringae]|nr:hypothetical protein CCL16_24610 [Pseudomonas syringae]
MIGRTQSVRKDIPTRSMGTIGGVADIGNRRTIGGVADIAEHGLGYGTHRSSRSSVGMPFMTLCVIA